MSEMVVFQESLTVTSDSSIRARDSLIRIPDYGIEPQVLSYIQEADNLNEKRKQALTQLIKASRYRQFYIPNDEYAQQVIQKAYELVYETEKHPTILMMTPEELKTHIDKYNNKSGLHFPYYGLKQAFNLIINQIPDLDIERYKTNRFIEELKLVSPESLESGTADKFISDEPNLGQSELIDRNLRIQATLQTGRWFLEKSDVEAMIRCHLYFWNHSDKIFCRYYRFDQGSLSLDLFSKISLGEDVSGDLLQKMYFINEQAFVFRIAYMISDDLDDMDYEPYEGENISELKPQIYQFLNLGPNNDRVDENMYYIYQGTKIHPFWIWFDKNIPEELIILADTKLGGNGKIGQNLVYAWYLLKDVFTNTKDRDEEFIESGIRFKDGLKFYKLCNKEILKIQQKK